MCNQGLQNTNLDLSERGGRKLRFFGPFRTFRNLRGTVYILRGLAFCHWSKQAAIDLTKINFYEEGMSVMPFDDFNLD